MSLFTIAIQLASATLPAATHLVPDTSVTNATTYFYVVSAVNAGGESANSPVASATPLPPPPAAPTNLAARAVSQIRIVLAWTDNATNESGYRIERSTNGTSFTQIATTGPNTTSFSNSGLSRDRLYYYRVRAYNAGGNSAYSAIAWARTFR